MATKSRYKMVNHGSKGNASWSVERNGKEVKGCMTRSVAAGFLNWCRKMESQYPECEGKRDIEASLVRDEPKIVDPELVSFRINF